jgi:hypothetical protein
VVLGTVVSVVVVVAVTFGKIAMGSTTKLVVVLGTVVSVVAAVALTVGKVTIKASVETVDVAVLRLRLVRIGDTSTAGGCHHVTLATLLLFVVAAVVVDATGVETPSWFSLDCTNCIPDEPPTTTNCPLPFEALLFEAMLI